jgi:hypothetical protein
LVSPEASPLLRTLGVSLRMLAFLDRPALLLLSLMALLLRAN